jgi:hypothetical protein
MQARRDSARFTLLVCCLLLAGRTDDLHSAAGVALRSPASADFIRTRSVHSLQREAHAARRGWRHSCSAASLTPPLCRCFRCSVRRSVSRLLPRPSVLPSISIRTSSLHSPSAPTSRQGGAGLSTLTMPLRTDAALFLSFFSLSFSLSLSLFSPVSPRECRSLEIIRVRR